MKKFESTDGEVRTICKNGTAIVEVGENVVFSDYVELLTSVAGGPEVADALLLTPELRELAEEWDWRDFMQDGMDIMDISEEAEWFQAQMNGAFEIEDGGDWKNWKQKTPKTERFGEY